MPIADDKREPEARKRLAGRSRAVTLREVAAVAQVSEITVSRVLRNHASVTEATRGRVMAAVREIGYVPNRLAGGLASSGSRLVAVIVLGSMFGSF